MTALERSEESLAVGRERQILPRCQGVFDSMNTHSQAYEPPLSFVMAGADTPTSRSARNALGVRSSQRAHTRRNCWAGRNPAHTARGGSSNGCSSPRVSGSDRAEAGQPASSRALAPGRDGSWVELAPWQASTRAGYPAAVLAQYWQRLSRIGNLSSTSRPPQSRQPPSLSWSPRASATARNTECSNEICDAGIVV
jgi:hypothetical protein